MGRCYLRGTSWLGIVNTVLGWAIMGRCYLRGTSWLGIVNTVLGCLFNRVLVRVRDSDTWQVIDWFWDKADKWPPQGGI